MGPWRDLRVREFARGTPHDQGGRGPVAGGQSRSDRDDLGPATAGGHRGAGVGGWRRARDSTDQLGGSRAASPRSAFWGNRRRARARSRLLPVLVTDRRNAVPLVAGQRRVDDGVGGCTVCADTQPPHGRPPGGRIHACAASPQRLGRRRAVAAGLELPSRCLRPPATGQRTGRPVSQGRSSCHPTDGRCPVVRQCHRRAGRVSDGVGRSAARCVSDPHGHSGRRARIAACGPGRARPHEPAR